MNLFYYEVKSSMKASIIWTASLIGVLMSMMLGVYPIYRDSKDEVTAIFSRFPAGFSATFGVDIETLFSYSGFYDFIFNYIALIGAIMAVALAMTIFAKEKRAKCSDFLLTKPISRASIFREKLLACFTIITLVTVIYVSCALVLFSANKETAISFERLLLALLGFFFVQLVFMSFGIAIATFSKKIPSIPGIATALGFAGFILSAMANIFNEKNLDVIAPLKYFEPSTVFETGGYSVKLSCLAVVIVMTCLLTSFVKFCNSDSHLA